MHVTVNVKKTIYTRLRECGRDKVVNFERDIVTINIDWWNQSSGLFNKFLV